MTACRRARETRALACATFTYHTFKVALGFIQPPLLQVEVPPLELRLIQGSREEEQTQYQHS